MRGRISPIIQMGQTECGLCAAAMLMDYYGVKLKIHDLSTKFEVGRDGSSIEDLKKIFRTYRFKVGLYEVQGGLGKISNNSTPCIAYHRRGHFVVVEKIQGGNCFILDPAFGSIKIKLNEFEKYYKNMLIRIKPDIGFEKINTRKKEFHLIAEAALHNKKLMVLTILSAFFIYTLTLTIPIIIKNLINRFQIMETLDNEIIRLLVMLGGSSIVFFVVNQMKLLVGIKLSICVDRYLSDKVINKLFSNRTEYFLNRSSTEIQYRLVLLKNLKTVISETMINAILDIGVIFVIILYVAHYGLLYTVLLAGITVLLVGYSLIMRNHMIHHKSEEIARDSELQILQHDIFRSIHEVKILGLSYHKKKQWIERYLKYIEAHKNNQIFLAFYRNVLAYISLYFPITIVIMGIIISSVTGKNEIGTIISMQALTGVYISGSISLSNMADSITTVKTLLLRIEDILVQNDEKDGEVTIDIKGNIDIKGVSFCYPGGKEDVLSDISFSIAEGEKVAIVGESGSGKSTLFYVLLGVYDSYRGEILYEGNNLRTLKKDCLRKQIASVPQNTVLFNGSIKDNLSNDSSISDDAISAALKTVALDCFVESLPMGINTIISENAGNISGGQRQRIAIARAIIEEKPLLMLDEATSSLDNITEKKINDCLKGISKTKIIIAHRLDTIKESDKIVVMKKGRIIEIGNHESLMASKGEYYKMYNRTRRLNGKEKNEIIAS